MLILLKCCGTCSTCVSNIQYCVVEFTAVQQTCWNSWANLVGEPSHSNLPHMAVRCVMSELSWSVAASVSAPQQQLAWPHALAMVDFILSQVAKEPVRLKGVQTA